ncbi:hypothetical protein Cni_G25324 [Canna indica]|uniref:ABC transporter domain-containing protein n=1 Tax=Canna indica TaxID=4628 RepID=A0AAQ3KZU0_9LILI|nr:hypothetical protein Cni_G25324 [Canna indica]
MAASNGNELLEIETGALPSLPNYVRDTVEAILTSLRLLRSNLHTLTILDNVSGVVQPGRMTLLLGPPGSGKTTLLLALAGKLDSTLKRTGDVKYNGCGLDKFCAQRTSAYISQTDNHIGELTVRETFNFAARCQGASKSWADYLKDIAKLEKEKGIHPSPEIDAFMKVASVGDGENNLVTEYTLKVLGLDVCANTLVGSDMVRGVSGGQKKRVTTGEMIVGPRKTLFMDEISTGLDSSTTYQIVKCMRNFVHQMEGTVLMSLLQPAPETFDLFDDMILLSEGHIVYHGPREKVLEFFESIGFSLPPRKGVADFLQEVTSRKDQEKYWSDKTKPYALVPSSAIAEMFKKSEYGRSIQSNLSVKDGKKFHPSALARTNFAISKWDLLLACFSRELILLSRHRFLYIIRTCQVAFMGVITCTLFVHSRSRADDFAKARLYLSCLFFGLVHMMFNGLSELPITISRLPVFYKQRDNLFYPPWAFVIPSWLLRIPYSIVEAVIWSCVVYYTVGFAPNVGRFFSFMLLLFSVHQMGLGLFRMIAAIARDFVLANTFGSAALLVVFLLGGFIVPKHEIKSWWSWAFWVSPLTYGQQAISVNEFTDSKWSKVSAYRNYTIGDDILLSIGISTHRYWYWIGVGVLLGYSILFNIVLTLALAYLNPLGKAQALIPTESEEQDEGIDSITNLIILSITEMPSSGESTHKKGMILPFQPLVMTFHNVNYFVNMPKTIKGVTPIPDGYNPATWMLEISTPACEERLDLDFATVYKNSDQFRKIEALIDEQSVPAAGTKPLRFETDFSQDKLSQFIICCRKQFIIYWRSPKYNVMRLFFAAFAALILGSIFWNVGSKRETTQDLLLVMGALYSTCLFVGVKNASTVQPVISIERTVYYRERATRMYSSLPYAAAQGLVEVPYILAQTVIFGVITFFMVNYERNLAKFVLYLLFLFLTLMYFTFYGMMAVGLTPTQHLAAVISSAFYSLWNLLSGFLIPQSSIPGWWIWYYYICPVAWTLHGIIISQLGDVESIIVGPGFKGTVKEYIEESLGYETGPGMTVVSAVVLLAFSVLFFSVYVISIKVLNFQKR